MGSGMSGGAMTAGEEMIPGQQSFSVVTTVIGSLNGPAQLTNPTHSMPSHEGTMTTMSNYMNSSNYSAPRQVGERERERNRKREREIEREK